MRLLALPAELYPQIKGCAEYFLFNFSEGCVTASTGLPAELYPQVSFSSAPQCRGTIESIARILAFVNRFFQKN